MCAARVDGVERLLVLRANGLGDLVVAEPALAALRAAYRGAEIVLAGATHAAALFNNRPAPVDRVELAPRVPGVRFDAGGAERVPDDPPEVVEAFCARMRAEGFDLAVQLHGGGGNANPLLRRFGARVTAGSRAPGAPPLDRTVPYHPFQHDVLRWLEVVGLVVGADPVRLSPRLAVTAEDLAAADAALSAAGLEGCGRDPAPTPGPRTAGPRTAGAGPAGARGRGGRAPLVALHPGATDARRRWPPERLAAVADALAARGAPVVVRRGPGDTDLVARILDAAASAPADLSGALSLAGLVGVLARADLFVGNDSGPRHVAEAVGTPTVGVFTKANLVDVAPLFRARHRVLVSWASRCAVCGLDYLDGVCGHDATVLGDVDAGTVAAAAIDLLAAGAGADGAPPGGSHRPGRG